MGDITHYNVALFLHIAVVIFAFMIAGVLHVSLNVLARAKTVEEARPWAGVVHRLEPMFPILAVLILVFGAWLIGASHKTRHWGDGWILTALITLIVIEALGGLVLSPHAKKLVAAIEEAPAGAIGPDVRARTIDPMLWDLSHIATFGFLGVVFVMTNKPSGGGAVIIVVIGAVVGILLSRWQLAIAGRGSVAAAASEAPATP